MRAIHPSRPVPESHEPCHVTNDRGGVRQPPPGLHSWPRPSRSRHGESVMVHARQTSTRMLLLGDLDRAEELGRQALGHCAAVRVSARRRSPRRRTAPHASNRSRRSGDPSIRRAVEAGQRTSRPVTADRQGKGDGPPPSGAYDVGMTQHPAADSRPTRHVLVVCAGNICRSPTAEAVLRALGTDDSAVDLEVRSRGTHDWNVGRHAHPTMARIAAERGYDLSGHIATQVTADDLAWADDVLQ